MHSKNIITAGTELREAKKAIILLHGRGASAQDILNLGSHLNTQDFALLAPQATDHTWYPYSFLAPRKENEPWLSSALSILEELVKEVKEIGISSENIYFAGFSQGACLCLEFVARNAEKFGGIAAFTGGLIGEELNPKDYHGDFENCPIFISTGDPDPHVPVERVQESVSILKNHHARVELKIYPNRPHTITTEEIELANKFVFE
jgi:phospholipase/carboxylesterase